MIKNYSQKTTYFKSRLCVLIATLVSSNCFAGDLTISVNTKKNQPLEGVVVTLARVDSIHQSTSTKALDIKIEQIDREFVPAVTVIPTGSLVSFPNQDEIMHHVYSFSKAKTFDLPLYKGIPSEPIKFDNVGVATLGCNIHDWMSAYVVIVDTPYYQKTDELGEALLSSVSEGEYELVLWHPRQKKPYTETITINDQSLAKKIELRLKPSFRSQRQNSNSKRRYK